MSGRVWIISITERGGGGISDHEIERVSHTARSAWWVCVCVCEGAEASNDSPEMIFPSAPQRAEIVPDRIYGNGHKNVKTSVMGYVDKNPRRHNLQQFTEEMSGPAVRQLKSNFLNKAL